MDYRVAMGSHPLNLALRFVLEIAALAAVGSFGWHRHEGLLRWIAAIGLPLLFAALWGTFAVPDDPSRGGTPLIPVPGLARLALEGAFFASAAWCLHASGHPRAAMALGGVTLLHYAASWDRVLWLLRV